MAYRNLNLAATLQLNAQQFKNGLSSAVRELESFRKSFLNVAGALGASIGIGGIVSSIKETATQLSVAQATLKNVSKDYHEFGETTEWVNGLSEKYKQNIITLTDSFAKFHAASMGTNMTMAEQKELYQGLVQAATYFHMSTERTENMLVAVEQMMSKGKVTAEELRRQLGNNLPGAYARVAQAAIEMGKQNQNSAYSSIKSFADFETAMKKGQIGVDVLLQFVRDLNEETKNFDTNSLQLAANEMSNAWAKLVESSQVEGVIKRVYQLTTNLFTWLRTNLDWLIPAVGTTLAGFALGRVAKAIVDIGKAIKGLQWSTWVGVAISAIGALSGVLVGIERRINNINRTLKEIGDLPDKTEQLARTLELADKAQNLINNPTERENWQKWKDSFSTSDKPVFGNTAMEQAGKAAYDAGKGVFDKARAEEYQRALDTLPQINQKIADLRDELGEQYTIGPVMGRGDTGFETPPNITTPTDNTKGKKPKTVQDYVEDYEKKFNELNNQLHANSISSDEFEEEIMKLSKTAWENVTAFDNFREKLAALPETLKGSATNLEKIGSAAVQLEQDSKEAKDRAEYQQKWDDYYRESAKSRAELKPRDSRFDYNKKDYEILREESEQWKQISENLQSEIDKVKKTFDETDAQAIARINELSEQMTTATANATSLKDAADVSQWQEDLKNLTKEYKEGVTNGITGLATSLDRVTSGWLKMKKAMEDEDASGWEKMITVLSEIVQIFETINGLVTTFQTLQKASQLLEKAKNAEELKALAQKATAEGAVIAAKATENALTQTSTGLIAGETAAAAANTAAKSGEAISSATASGAKLPFPYNLIGIAAGVAAVIAALSQIKGFANGGIVNYGTRAGDKTLARVNKSEMILTPSHQAKLWNAISSGNLGNSTGGKVEFEIRGDRLRGVLENYNQKRRG